MCSVRPPLLDVVPVRWWLPRPPPRCTSRDLYSRNAIISSHFKVYNVPLNARIWSFVTTRVVTSLPYALRRESSRLRAFFPCFILSQTPFLSFFYVIVGGEDQCYPQGREGDRRALLGRPLRPVPRQEVDGRHHHQRRLRRPCPRCRWCCRRWRYVRVVGEPPPFSPTPHDPRPY